MVSSGCSATGGGAFVSSAGAGFVSTTAGFAFASLRLPFSFDGTTAGFGATDLEAPFSDDGFSTAACTDAGAGVCELRAEVSGFAGFCEGFAGPNELLPTRGSGATLGGAGRTLVTTLGGEGEYEGRTLPDAATCGGRPVSTFGFTEVGIGVALGRDSGIGAASLSL